MSASLMSTTDHGATPHDAHQNPRARTPRRTQKSLTEAPMLKPIRSASALDSAFRRVLCEIDDGLRHGYFDFALTCEVTGNGRRRLTLRAGKTYQFLIPADDCDRRRHFSQGDPRDEGTLYVDDHDAVHPGDR
jgi:hypothetical protein